MPITNYYVSSDGMGNVTAIVDEDGNVLERRNYDAFGEMSCMLPDGTPVATSPTGVDVGFHGQVREEATGLYQMGYRWYSPTLGRWLSRDPVALWGGPNLFTMAGNCPVTRGDAYGLYEEDGHYYTTFMVLRANGYPVRDAEEIAFYSQLPDEDPTLDAREAGEKLLLGVSANDKTALRDIQNYLHSLHGGKAIHVFFRRECLRCLLSGGVSSLKNWEKGLLIHALADSYAHTAGSGDDAQAYGAPLGHAVQSLTKWTNPDAIANSVEKYSDYIEALDSAVGSKMNQHERLRLVRAMSKTQPSQAAAIADARKLAIQKYGLPRNYKPEGGMNLGNRRTIIPDDVREFILRIASACT
jgi:RHS repeat-associated protein